MKITIDVPDSLKDVTLEQYQEYIKLEEIDENKNTHFLFHKLVEIFCNITLKDIIKIKWNSLLDLVNQINKLFEEEHKLIKTFKLNGKEYGFIPELDEITLGEFIDLDNYITDWDNMHKALNVLYRPITYKKGDSYIIEDYKVSDALEFKKTPLNVTFGALFFFYHLNNELVKVIPSYLKVEAEKHLTYPEKRSLLLNGDGINLSMDWLEEMLTRSTKLLD